MENIIAAVVDGLITSLIHLFFTKKNHSDGLKKTKKELENIGITNEYTCNMNSNWSFIANTNKNRKQRLVLCDYVVKNILEENDKVLFLDSGSTVDAIPVSLINNNKNRNVTIYSNSISAAILVSRTNALNFHLIGGCLNGRYAATYTIENNYSVYSDKSYDAFILSTTCIRAHTGLYADRDDEQNRETKRFFLQLFTNNRKKENQHPKLIIVASPEKFIKDVDLHCPIQEEKEWKQLCRQKGAHIHLVTCLPPKNASYLLDFTQKIEQFKKLLPPTNIHICGEKG